MTHVILTDLDGKQFRATPQQRDALETLTVARAGGLATVYGYVATSGRVKPETADLTILTRFSTGRLYERKSLALSDITFSQVRDAIAKVPKLAALKEQDAVKLFNDCKAKMVDSMSKTLDGDRSDAHRQGHDRCYARVADGIKVHYDTVKVDGIMQPVLTDGLPTVKSIMVHYLQISKTVREAGEYKVVNSGEKVLMDGVIESQLNAKSVSLKTLSLKEDNFDRLVVARKTYLPEDVSSIPADILLD